MICINDKNALMIIFGKCNMAANHHFFAKKRIYMYFQFQHAYFIITGAGVTVVV